MIVLVASELVDVVIDQPTKTWVLQQLEATPVCSPAHQLAEVLSPLGRLVRAGELDLRLASEAATEASALQQELVPPEADHLVQALEMQTSQLAAGRSCGDVKAIRRPS